jgi:hypothetical protein
MEVRYRVVGLLVQVLCASCALWAAGAAAKPVNGPRETVDHRFTATRATSPTGLSYSGSYHAAGDRKGSPPAMRKMVFYYPRGMRFDTTVPARCTASDVELELRGPDACPAASRLGGGTTEGLFMVPVTHSFVFDHYKHPVTIVNNANEQVVLIESEGFTVVRGRIRPDGAIEFNPTTCFPAPPTGQCADDYIIQLGSSTVTPPYKRATRGRVRSYATTPPTCPARGYWRTPVRFWWADGSADTVVTKQPCRRAPKSRR